MTTETVSNEVKALHQKLTDCFNIVELGVAGRLIYYDAEKHILILAVHTTSPEKAEEATKVAWESIPEDLKAELEVANIGFAGRQI